MLARSQCPGSLCDTRIMLVILACCLAVAAAAPATYDQRQDGEDNIHAEIKNVAILFAIPQEVRLPAEVIDVLLNLKTSGREAAQDRGDVELMGAFVEPSTTYKVEIGPKGLERSVTSEGRAVEVVIAGRRSDEEPQPEGDKNLKEIQPEKAPEVIPSSK